MMNKRNNFPKKFSKKEIVIFVDNFLVNKNLLEDFKNRMIKDVGIHMPGKNGDKISKIELDEMAKYIFEDLTRKEIIERTFSIYLKRTGQLQ